MFNRRHGRMEHYVGSPSAIDPDDASAVAAAILHSVDGITTFDGQSFGAPVHEKYKTPDLDLSHPSLRDTLAKLSINEALVA